MTQKNPMGLGKDPLDTLLPDAIQVPSKERATIKRCVNSRGGEYPSGLT